VTLSISLLWAILDKNLTMGRLYCLRFLKAASPKLSAAKKITSNGKFGIK
jgi:hypothetical protein